MERFILRPDEIAAIGEEINLSRTEGLIRSKSPSFYLVGGQPGCGKTELIKVAQRRESDNLLICNADDLRNYHPHSKEILANHEERYPDITWPYACQWNMGLKEYGIHHKFNVLVETTLRDKEQVLDQFRQMKILGYRTHLFILAVPARISWISTCLRFEMMKRAKNYGQRVHYADHDDRVASLIKNVPEVVSCLDIEVVEVYARIKQVLTDASTGLNILTNEAASALSCFTEQVKKEADYSD